MTVYPIENKDKKLYDSSPVMLPDSAVLLMEGDKLKRQLPMIQPIFFKEKLKNDVIITQKRRMGALHICLALIILPLGLVLLTSSIWLYKHLNEKDNHYIGRCGVDFHQTEDLLPDLPREGRFESQLEFSNLFEKFIFPNYARISGSITIHDTTKNVTAVADLSNNVCFVMPLNRSHVFRPFTVIDLLQGSKPISLATELVKSDYRLVTPALTYDQLIKYGPLVMDRCGKMDTFQLKPVAKEEDEQEKEEEKKKSENKEIKEEKKKDEQKEKENDEEEKLMNEISIEDKNNNKLNKERTDEETNLLINRNENFNKNNKANKLDNNNNNNNNTKNNNEENLEKENKNKKHKHKHNHNKRGKEKRSICELKGKSYCESANEKKLFCFTIKGCV